MVRSRARRTRLLALLTALGLALAACGGDDDDGNAGDGDGTETGGGDEGPDYAWANAFADDPGAAAGPFRLKEWEKGSYVTLERNPDYGGEPAGVQEITFRFIPSPEQPAALANGEVDVIYPQPQIDLIEQVREIDGVNFDASFGVTWEHMTYNVANPVLADVRVRQAIGLAVDRQALVDTLMKPFSDEATVLQNHVYVNNQPEYAENAGEFAARDLERAGALLDEAGWTVGSDGVREKDGDKLVLRIGTTGGDALRERTQELLQAQLKDAGIELRIENVPEAGIFDVIFGGEATAQDWDLALFAWVGTPTAALDYTGVYGTGQGNNPGGYSNEEADALLAQATAEVDDTARAALMNQVDQLLWQDPPNLPLYQKPTFVAYKDTIENVVDNTSAEGLTWNADKWTRTDGEDTITIAAEQELSGWNTNLSTTSELWAAMVARLVWPQGYFVTPDVRFQVGHAFAKEAEVVSQDPFTVRWTINPDAVWSDGTPVSSDDLEYYWQSCNGVVDEGEPVLEEEGEEVTGVDCINTTGYDSVETFTKVDEKTAEAVFTEPIAEYESLFSTPFPPAHLAREYDASVAGGE